MALLSLKLLFINLYLVTSFEHRFSTSWERMVKKVIETGGDLVNVEAEEKWIEQPLDHDNENDHGTWKMRYFEDLSNWRSGGPVILVIGGESEAEPARFGLVYELATETNAAVFFSEHRYYGKSLPFINLTTSNFKYLSSQQALHDNANLLKLIKSDTNFSTSKIVVAGGSYSGNLAAWIRLLFPQLVDAAISSSAPVLAKKDCFEVTEALGEVFNKYGSRDCYEKISKRFSRYKELFKTASGIEILKKENNVCTDVDFTKKDNIMFFFWERINYEFFKVLIAKSPKDIQERCSSPTINVFSRDSDCKNYTIENQIEVIKSGQMTASYYSWMYQICTEFAYFLTGNSEKQPFTDILSVEFYITMCKGVYGPEFNERKVDEGVAQTNKMYGGLRPAVNKVVFVNGDMDPYAALGIKESLSRDAPAIVIEGGQHCSDFKSSPVNAEARKKWDEIKQIVKSWIGV